MGSEIVIERRTRQQCFSQMRNFILMALLCAYAAALGWTGRAALGWGRWVLVGSAGILLVPFLFWLAVRVAALMRRELNLPAGLQRVVDKGPVVWILLGGLFMIAGLCRWPPWLFVLIGGLMAVWVVFLLVLAMVWLRYSPREPCRGLVQKVEIASWPMVWAAFQVGVAGNYGNIVRTIAEGIEQGGSVPWYLERLPEAAVVLAFLVVLAGLFATVLSGGSRPEAE